MSDRAVRMLCRTLLACTFAVLTKVGNFSEWWDLIVGEAESE